MFIFSSKIKGIFFLETARALVCLLLVLVGFELVLRMNNDFNMNIPFESTKPDEHGNEMWRGQPFFINEFNQVVKRNFLGYHDYDPRKKKGVDLRIAVIGDSRVEAIQVPRDKIFTAHIEKMLPGVQMLAFGQSGRADPEQFVFFKYEFPLIFTEAQYPVEPVQGVIFCVDTYGFLHIVKGDRYPLLTRDKPKWQNKFLKPLVTPGQKYFEQNFHSPSHALGLLSYKMYQWLSADLDRTLPEIDEKRIALAKEGQLKRVLQPMVHLARDVYKIRIGFYYLPNRQDLDAPNAFQKQMRQSVLENIEALDVPFVDGMKYVHSPEYFYRYDMHAKPEGHRLIANGIKDLIQERFPETRGKTVPPSAPALPNPGH